MSELATPAIVGFERQVEVFRGYLASQAGAAVMIKGDEGTGRSTLINHYAAIAEATDRNSVVVTMRMREEAGFIPTLLELESRAIAAARMNVTAVSRDRPVQGRLARALRLQIDGAKPQLLLGRTVSGSPIDLVRATFEEISTNLLAHGRLVVLLDAVPFRPDEGDKRGSLAIEDLLGNLPVRTVAAVVPGDPTVAARLSKILESVAVGPLSEGLVTHATQETIGSDAGMRYAPVIWRAYLGDPLATGAALRYLTIRPDSSPEDLSTSTNRLTILRTLLGASVVVERAVLEALAISLEPLSVSEVASVLGWTKVEVARALSERPFLRLVTQIAGAAPERFYPFHDEFSEAILDRINPQRLKELHLRAAKRYFHSSLDKHWEHPSALGFCLYHLERSGQPDLIDYLTLPETRTLLRAWGMGEIAEQAYPPAVQMIDSYTAGSVWVATPGSEITISTGPARDQARRLLYRDWAYFRQLRGEPELRESGEAHPPDGVGLGLLDRAMIATDRAQIQYQEGQRPEAEAQILGVIELLEQTEDPDAIPIRLNAIHNLGVIRREAGQLNAAIESFSREVSLARDSSSLTTLRSALLDLGRTYYMNDRQDEALAAFRAALSLATDPASKDEYSQGVALGHIAAILFGAGRISDALPHAKEAVAAFRVCGANDDLDTAEMLVAQIQTQLP